eukprot:5632839-Prymnesium_polylepis.1
MGLRCGGVPVRDDGLELLMNVVSARCLFVYFRLRQRTRHRGAAMKRLTAMRRASTALSIGGGSDGGGGE